MSKFKEWMEVGDYNYTRKDIKRNAERKISIEEYRLIENTRIEAFNKAIALNLQYKKNRFKRDYSICEEAFRLDMINSEISKIESDFWDALKNDAIEMFNTHEAYLYNPFLKFDDDYYYKYDKAYNIIYDVELEEKIKEPDKFLQHCITEAYKDKLEIAPNLIDSLDCQNIFDQYDKMEKGDSFEPILLESELPRFELSPAYYYYKAAIFVRYNKFLNSLKNEPSVMINSSKKNVFRLSKKYGAKVKLFKLLLVIHSLNLLEFADGSAFPNKSEFFNYFGDLIGKDFSDFESNLHQAVKSEEAYLSIIDDIRKVLKDKYQNYLEKH